MKSYSHRAFKFLQKYLKDISNPIEIRKDLAKVLAQIGTQEAVRILLDEMNRESEDLDTEIINALDRIRAGKSDIHFPPKLIRKKILLIVNKYCQDSIDLMSLGSDEHNAEQGRELQKKQTVDISNIFKLLGLYYPHEDIVKAYQNLRVGSKDSVANAIEFLDNALNKKMKNVILPLVEDMSPPERQREFQKILKNLK